MTCRAIFFALALASCHRSGSSPSNVTPEPPLSSGAGDAGKIVAVKDSGSCASIYRARAEVDAGTFTGPGENCMVTKKGAWGLVLDGPPPQPFGPPRSTWETHAIHASGASTIDGPRESWSGITKLSVFDFDGDGEEELIVEGTRGCLVNADLQCQGDLPELEIMTSRNARVDFYPAPVMPGLAPAHVALTMGKADGAPPVLDESDKTLHYRAVRDVDGDGRPDFETYAFYEASTDDMDVTSFFLHGPTFLAHSLPDGSFSLTDDVAMKKLAESCAAAVPFAKAKPADLFTTAVCARLSGEPPSAIERHYVARCIPLYAPVQAFWTAMAHGKPTPPRDIDFTAAGTCRTEPEGAWSAARGTPKSLARMLEETKPLLEMAKKP